jgi:tripartite-type tricarboxylate transporter receptor subunit TctC
MLKPIKTRLLVSAIAVAAALSLPGAALAQVYPNKTIKLITPFPAGLGPDVLLRIVADKLSREWGQAVIVENKPGASGFIAFEAAKRSPADGYTLVQMDNYHIGTQPHLFSKLPYSAFNDFEPVTPLVRNSFFVVVPATSKWNTMAELIAAARTKPGAVSYGSWNVASPAHLGGLLLESATGTQMTHVPFKESSQLYQSVANGEVDWALGSAVSAGPVVQAGKARFLAVAASSRTAGYANVPTSADSGAPASWTVGGWFGLLAPKGTPKDVIQRINDGVTKAMQAPDVRERLATFTYEAYTMAPADMAKLMQQEVAKWGPTIKQAAIKLD